MPLPGLDDYSHSLTAGFDYKDVKQSVQLAGSPDTGSPIRYAPVTIGYSGSILGKNSATKFEAGSVIGVRGFLHGDNDPVFNAKRLGATARFSRLKLGLERNQTLDGWALHGRIDLQLASEPLISDEQYAAGGADNVRGYLEGEEYGDDAVHASVQIETPSLALGDTSAAWKLAGVAFYDAAKLHNQNVGFPTPAYKLIRGRGLGLRLQGPKGAALELDWARAMDATAYTSAGEQRLYGRLTIAF